MAEQIEEVPAELIQTRVYELHPNKTMRRVLDEACDYRRYCWNQGLALWNEMYKARQALKSSLASDSKKLTEEQKVLLKEKPSPSERRVRNMLVADKKDWQYTQSARILQLAISDLGKVGTISLTRPNQLVQTKISVETGSQTRFQKRPKQDQRWNSLFGTGKRKQSSERSMAWL